MGVKRLMNTHLPYIIFWHCANHRLELSVDDTVKEVTDINRLIDPAVASLQNTVKLIPISSSEAERGFSQMNSIVTPTRASLATTTVSSLLFIRLVGPPLRKFNPANYINSWMDKGQHFADDTNSKKHKRDSVDSVLIWKSFGNCYN